jgi:hypothetical protein
LIELQDELANVFHFFRPELPGFKHRRQAQQGLGVVQHESIIADPML